MEDVIVHVVAWEEEREVEPDEEEVDDNSVTDKSRTGIHVEYRETHLGYNLLSPLIHTSKVGPDIQGEIR